MTIAWYVCGYKIDVNRPNVRFCAMNDFNTAIQTDGGAWAESECLGGNAIVKVKASDATLNTIAGTNSFDRIPWAWLLQDTMAQLTNAQYNVVRSRVNQMGYTDAEIDAVLGASVAEWRTHTFQQLLNFICQRRLKPRFDAILQQIVLDGDNVSCRPPADVDKEIQ